MAKGGGAWIEEMTRLVMFIVNIPRRQQLSNSIPISVNHSKGSNLIHFKRYPRRVHKNPLNQLVIKHVLFNRKQLGRKKQLYGQGRPCLD